MGLTTTPLGFPYPVAATDPPNGAAQIQALAEAVQQALGSVAGGLQEGVIESGAFEVTQASGGASTVLDVASNVGSGVYVTDDGLSPARQALFYVPPTAAKSTVTAANGHATLPRVDAIVVSMAGVVSLVAGTATSGATLDNARDGSHGGAAIPSDALHLADVLVPATDTTLSNNQIRDRRKWARGAYAVTALSAGAASITSTSFVTVHSSLKSRIECSGVPLKVSFRSFVAWGGSGGGALSLLLKVDGSDFSGASGGTFVFTSSDLATDGNEVVDVTVEFTPTAGSHTLEWFVRVTSGDTAVFTGVATAGYPATITVEEVLRQNAANNTTTSG